jgi:hypothetical protein
MLFQSEIRSAAVSNETCIAIANRTGNLANFRHRRRRIRIGRSVGYFVYYLAMTPALLLRPCGRARFSCGRGNRSRVPRIREREVASESIQSRHFVCQCHSWDTLEKCNVYAQRVAPNSPLTRKTLLNLMDTNFRWSECCTRDQADRHTTFCKSGKSQDVSTDARG